MDMVGYFFSGWLALLDKWMSGDQGALPLLGAAAVTVGATMGLGFWMASTRSTNKIEPLVDRHMQTRELPVTFAFFSLNFLLTHFQECILCILDLREMIIEMRLFRTLLS